MLFDTHAHLNDDAFLNDLEETMKSAREAGVKLINIVGFDDKSIKRALEIVKNYEELYLTVGWHPVEAIDFNQEKYDMIKEIALTNPKVIAIGEIGLDYHWDKSPKDIQKEVFRKQIALAKEVNKPIVIHCREAMADVLEILKEENAKEVGGIMHCFSGSVESMNIALKENFLISLGGPVTYKNAKKAKEVAKLCPLDKLLVETDCPYLSPVPYRGQRNEPAYVKNVAQEIADLREMTYTKLAEASFENACRLFNIDYRK
ncbi:MULTISPECIES: TatD family hydrolase [unclassified Gemella]|uniref:TatD family hydrolase n=1 Tax=unclassified Gemella TaxID=2624949 RepID=UPI0015CFE69F|nr:MULTISPECIES: TatD family hydrolase [unclassified Gemella]MBF0710425.1 TatD family hydrolase [Gemella sp. GL1.1]NYS27769.1 TatD family hydrolase [Gemella sp. GL1]